MKNIDITPEAYNDLAVIKEKLDEEFGEAQGKKILKAIFKDLRRLAKWISCKKDTISSL